MKYKFVSEGRKSWHDLKKNQYKDFNQKTIHKKGSKLYQLYIGNKKKR